MKGEEERRNDWRTSYARLLRTFRRRFKRWPTRDMRDMLKAMIVKDAAAKGFHVPEYFKRGKAT